MALVLEPDEQDLLQFVLDTTLERWRNELPGSLEAISEDPTLASWEAILQASGSVAELNTQLERIRDKVVEERGKR